MDAVLEALEADPHVEYVQRDYQIELDQGAFPNDPFFSSLGAWGQSHPDLWGPDRVAAPEVWGFAQGEGAIIAVVDTGLDGLHPDIAENVWVNPGEDLDGDGLAEPEDRNGIDDDANGYVDDLTGYDFASSIDRDQNGDFEGPGDVSDADPFDDNGHGTHVAGTAAAVGDNDLGIIGIAPRARVMALKGFPAKGPASDATLWQAVLYAAENGATVINNSWSCGSACPDNPLADEVLAIVEALGAVVVTSAGNATEDVLFRSPENGPRVITVGSIGFDDRLSDFSNRGWLMDVVAPGGGPNEPRDVWLPRRNILSLLSSGTREIQLPFAVGGDYLRFSGTSMAAPHVTGAVALLRSLRPELTPREVRRLIRMSARDLGAPGHDPDFGPGLLDVATLVEAPLPDLTLELESPRPGRLHDPSTGDLVIRARASGSDLESLELEVGRGLSARSFSPLELVSGSIDSTRMSRRASDTMIAHWDVAEVPDGPYVLRLRAGLRDGRVVEEHSIVGIERNTPQAIWTGEIAARRPAISGRRVVWREDEDSQTRDLHDLVIGRFLHRNRANRNAEQSWATPFRLEREGDQTGAVLAGDELAWLTVDESGTTLEHCRLGLGDAGCEPARVAVGPGTLGAPWLARGWLVWSRSDHREIVIEGCRVGPGNAVCTARPLVDEAAGGGWQLRSFDGETLLLGRAGTSTLSVCRLPEAGDEACIPEPIALAPGSPIVPLEPVHDGSLMVFKDVSVESLPAPGCETTLLPSSCVSTWVLARQLYACWLDGGEPFCDPHPVGQPAPVDSTAGLQVSGRRIVWAVAASHEQPSIRFCEFVPQTGECEEQRLSGAPAAQRRPALDGGRVVWEDGRAGPAAIHGLELPWLSLREHVSLQAGRPFSLPLRGRPGSSRALRFEVAPLEGLSPEEAEVRIVSLGRKGRRARLQGHLPDDFEGKALWRIRAISAGGLFSERVIEVDVVPAEQRRWAYAELGGRRASVARAVGSRVDPSLARSRLTSILEGFLAFLSRLHDHVVARGEPAGGIGERRISQ